VPDLSDSAVGHNSSMRQPVSTNVAGSKLRLVLIRVRAIPPRSRTAALTIFAIFVASLIAISTNANGVVTVSSCAGLGTLQNGSFEQDGSGVSGPPFSGTGFDGLGNGSGGISSANGWYAFNVLSGKGDLTNSVYQVMDRNGNQSAPVNTSSTPGLLGWKTTESYGNVEIQRVYIGSSIPNVTASNSSGTTTFTTSSSANTPFAGQRVYLSGFTGTFSTSTPYIVASGNTHTSYSGTTFTVSNLSLTGTGSIQIAYTASSEVDQVAKGEGTSTPGYDNSTVTPIDGTYMAEINAQSTGTLFQVLPTGDAGITERWSLYHAARASSESMYVVIAPAANSSGAQQSDSWINSNDFGSTYYQGTSSANAITRITQAGTVNETSTSITSGGAMTDSPASASDRAAGNTTAWTLYQGAYTIPSGNTSAYTVFGFQSTSGGTIGNLLDDIQFSPVAACPLSDTVVTNTTSTLDPFTCVSDATCSGASPALAPQVQGTATRSVSIISQSGDGSATANGENITFSSPATAGTTTVTYQVDYNANGIDSSSQGTITFTTTTGRGTLQWQLGSASTTDDGTCTAGSYNQVRNLDTVTVTLTAPGGGNGRCSWTPPSGVTSIAAVVVGGGGGGGGRYVAGGGGAGAYLYESAIAVSGQVSIVIGAGGSGGTSVGGNAGSSGNQSSLTVNQTAYISVGGGGGGAYTSANFPGNGQGGGSGGGGSGNNTSTTQGSGGSVLSGSYADAVGHAGGAGAGGVTGNPGGGGGGSGSSGSAPTGGAGGSGGSGMLNPLTNTYLAAGGGGGSDSTCSTSASSIGGVGGCNSGSTAATSAVANTGSGGGGADQGSGGNGSSGIVIIQYNAAVEDQATNDPTIRVNANFLVTPTNTPVAWEYSAPLSNGACGTFSLVTNVTFPITSLSRGSGAGRCYYWSYTYSTPPTFSGTAASNLISPILYLPQQLTLNLPSVIKVDPRATYVDMPIGANLSGPDGGSVCIYESSGSSTNGGVGIAATGLTFDAANLGVVDSNNSGVTISGDQGTALQLQSNQLSNIGKLLASIRVSDANSSKFSVQRNILVRVLPTLPQSQFSYSCDPNSTAELRPYASDSYVIQLVPYDLSMTIDQPNTALGHH